MSGAVPEPADRAGPARSSVPDEGPVLPVDLRHRLQRSFLRRTRERLRGLLRPWREADREGSDSTGPGRRGITVDAGVVEIRADGSRADARRAAREAAELVADHPSLWRIVLRGPEAGRVRAVLSEVARASGCGLVEVRSDRGGRGDRIRLQEAPSPWQLALKRLVDVVGSAVGLVLLAPLLAVVAAGVKASSEGPVLFRQRRVGIGGRTFQLFKFRTMRPHAEVDAPDLKERSVYTDGLLFKVPDDPRVTAFGRLLRRSSIDELPQLLNVLRGEMSLVGPRPPLPDEVAEYRPEHHCRFDRWPGVTGPWQVSGRNRITDFEEVVRLERSYVEGWSLADDVAILVRTIPAVIEGDGAE